MKKYFTLLLIAVFFSVAGQRNLVKNPSFEATQCPVFSPDPADFITPWEAGPWNAPDYYEPNCGNPGSANTTNNSQPFDGEGFIGMRVYGQAGGDYLRDYIQGELEEPLEEGKYYRITFYVKPVFIGSGSFGIDNLGMLLTDSIVDTVGTDSIIPAVPQVRATDPIVNINYWTPVCGVYYARGGEKYITIGNFYTDNFTQAVPLDGSTNPQIGYYLFDAVEVIANDLPQLPADTIICQQGRVNIDISRPDFSYSWDPPAQFGLTGGRYAVTEPGIYTVRISSASCSYTDTLLVEAAECKDCKMYVPSAFTPNGDGKNDFFEVKASCQEDLVSYRMQIFDRWGQKVFESTDISISWNGKNVDHIGTYTYNLQYEFRKFRKTETQNIRGALVLIK